MPKLITKNQIDYNKVYQSNGYGEFIILEELPRRRTYDKNGNVNNTERMCRIKFIKTGYEDIVMVRNAVSGKIRDPYFPSICGVACLGNVIVGRNGPNKKLYIHFISMIRRCYYKQDVGYETHGGAGVTVCERWLCFENFLQDAPNLPGYNNMMRSYVPYSLDKDRLQQGVPTNKKIYSPWTCMWLSKIDNAIQEALDNRDKFKNPYMCVHEDRGKYRVRIRNRYTCKSMDLGFYDDLIAAVNVANYANRRIGTPEFINNDIEYMPLEECVKHRLGEHNGDINLW